MPFPSGIPESQAATLNARYKKRATVSGGPQINMASKNRAEHLSAEHVRLKRYFYVMRSLLAARWVAELQTAPPVPFAKLVDAQLEPAMKPLFNELIQRP